jgi:hypothetical protein
VVSRLVISARAKECYERNELVGRELQPILEQSAQSHVESGSTSGRIPSNSNNRF